MREKRSFVAMALTGQKIGHAVIAPTDLSTIASFKIVAEVSR